MRKGRNRPGRKDRSRIALAIACVVLACAAPAQAATGGIGTTGGASTAKAAQAEAREGIAFAPMRWAGATWYGPGLYGNQTACGQVLHPGTVGVAHRSLPCGTPVKFAYRGREIVTRVIDRGPYAEGKVWDLTNGARKALGFEGSDRVLYALALGNALESRR
jgi:rare lipoprotein A (peptidoglycan hydrolase)